MKLHSLPRFLSGLSALICAARLTAAAADAPFAGGRWIDLTHDFSTNTLYWPTAQRFTLETEFHAHTDKGYFYASNAFAAPHKLRKKFSLPSFSLSPLMTIVIVLVVSPGAKSSVPDAAS